MTAATTNNKCKVQKKLATTRSTMKMRRTLSRVNGSNANMYIVGCEMGTCDGDENAVRVGV